MFFTSYEFIGFVAVLTVLYYLVPKKLQWPLLLLASYLFYLASGPQYLLYIIATTVTVWFAARMIGRNQEKQTQYLKENKAQMSREEKKSYKESRHRVRLRWLVLCLLINIGILAVVKYANFFISNVNGILGVMNRPGRLSFVTLALPLGISFYTFQALGYLIDVHRGTVPAEKNPFRLALFVSFFPQLIQGPISRYGDLAETLYEPHAFDRQTVAYGLQRALWGYFKKLVIADRILTGVGCIIGDPDTYHGAYALVGMLFYTIELYADFTGGIDITIGIAQMLGISVQENFRRPYFSKSLKEYWRRWHISMSTWFKDYVFYPVSICKPMQKFAKAVRKHLGENVGKKLPVYVSSFVVWFATGIWHGASWNFVVWGLANWFVLMVSEELEPLYARFHSRFSVGRTRIYKLFAVARTFLLICVLNLFDCYEAAATTLRMFGSVFTARNWSILWDGSLLRLGITLTDYCVLAAGIVILLSVSLVQRGGSVRAKIAAKAYPVRVCVWFGLFLIVLLLGIYGIEYDSSQFIYNRF